MPLFLKVGVFMVFVVNNTMWRLEFVRPSSENLRRSDGSYTFGVTDNSVKTVFIMQNMSDYMIDKVICHELCHVHALEYDYYMPIEIEEIVADFMSLYGRKVVYLTDEIMDKIMRRIA